jgi:ATP-dependent Zn protease
VTDARELELATAYHEAAHAVAHIVMGYKLEHVSIDPPKDGTLGGTKGEIVPPSFEARLRQRDEFDDSELRLIGDEIVTYLLGEIAEARRRGDTYRLDPLNVRTDDERQVMGRIGALWPNYAEADEHLAALHTSAQQLAAEHWSKIETVASALLERRRLTGVEAQEVAASNADLLVPWTTRRHFEGE